MHCDIMEAKHLTPNNETHLHEAIHSYGNANIVFF